jgi:hypothetical protein
MREQSACQNIFHYQAKPQKTNSPHHVDASQPEATATAFASPARPLLRCLAARTTPAFTTAPMQTPHRRMPFVVIHFSLLSLDILSDAACAQRYHYYLVIRAS